jgi:spore maturation protein A
MLNKIWCFFILISIAFGFVTGNIETVNNSVFSSIENTMTLVIKMVGGMCFWSGIMNIAMNTTLQEKLKKLIKPINNIIFPKLDKKSKAYENISMNMATNMLGLGSAATPLGLKAVEELEKINANQDKISDDEIMFIAINTASLQVIPTNIITIRSSLGSNAPGDIILGVWFSSIIAFVSIIFITKFYLHIRSLKA